MQPAFGFLDKAVEEQGGGDGAGKAVIGIVGEIGDGAGEITTSHVMQGTGDLSRNLAQQANATPDESTPADTDAQKPLYSWAGTLDDATAAQLHNDFDTVSAQIADKQSQMAGLDRMSSTSASAARAPDPRSAATRLSWPVPPPPGRWHPWSP